MANIVVVEDDAPTRKNIVQILERSGYNTLAAEDAFSALEIVRRKAPDLIISDIMMPGMDGYELCRQVNSDSGDESIPFIFLTGKTEYPDFREGMLSGADDYILKPFQAVDLLKSVDLRIKKNNKYEKKFSQFKSSVIRNISHEFRTPLVPIIGYSQLIRENYWQLGPGEVLEMTDKIYSSGNWMLKMIEKFLFILDLEEEAIEDSANSRIQNSAITANVINQSVLQAGFSAERKDDILVNVTNDVLSVPEVDLLRMLNELLENACRFSSPGSPIEVTSATVDKFHHITITDYGKGMKPDEIKNISSFSQYSRMGMHRAGLGLGLTIVKRLAHKNNIELNIESQFGLFTRVTLKIPLTKNNSL